MKLKELKERSTQELEKLLREQRDALRALRFKVSADQHKNVRDVRAARLVIARCATLIRERSLNLSPKKLSSRKATNGQANGTTKA